MTFDFKSVVVGPIRSLVTSLQTTIDTVTHVFETGTSIIEDVIAISHEIENFELRPHWKIRVISAPEALENIKELQRVPTRLYIAIRDLVSRIKSSIGGFKTPLSEATEAAEEASTLEGGLLRLFPRLASTLGRVVTRILALAGLILQAVTDVANTINDIKVIVGELKTVIESLNHMDAIFLQQNNSRKTVVLEDGSRMKIRIGSLHQ